MSRYSLRQLASHLIHAMKYDESGCSRNTEEKTRLLCDAQKVNSAKFHSASRFILAVLLLCN